MTWDTCRSSQDTISHPSHSAIYITSQHTQTIGLAKKFIERGETNQRENEYQVIQRVFVLRCNDNV